MASSLAAVNETHDLLEKPPLKFFIASDELPIVHSYFDKRGFNESVDSVQLSRLVLAESRYELSIILDAIGLNMPLNSNQTIAELTESQLFRHYGVMIDWLLLGRMDRLGISASTFSHSANLLSRDSHAQH